VTDPIAQPSQQQTDRPREVVHGGYVATVSREEDTPWSVCTTWTITRDGVEVGKMFQGTTGYGERVTCSMRALFWTGKTPERSWDPKSPEHGLGFDIGPRDTRELALQAFAASADRLIAWRATQEDPDCSAADDGSHYHPQVPRGGRGERR